MECKFDIFMFFHSKKVGGVIWHLQFDMSAVIPQYLINNCTYLSQILHVYTKIDCTYSCDIFKYRWPWPWPLTLTNMLILYDFYLLWHKTQNLVKLSAPNLLEGKSFLNCNVWHGYLQLFYNNIDLWPWKIGQN